MNSLAVKAEVSEEMLSAVKAYAGWQMEYYDALVEDGGKTTAPNLVVEFCDRKSGQMICNPWYDPSGREELSDDSAVLTYGEENVVAFIRKLTNNLLANRVLLKTMKELAKQEEQLERRLSAVEKYKKSQKDNANEKLAIMSERIRYLLLVAKKAYEAGIFSEGGKLPYDDFFYTNDDESLFYGLFQDDDKAAPSFVFGRITKDGKFYLDGDSAWKRCFGANVNTACSCAETIKLLDHFEQFEKEFYNRFDTAMGIEPEEKMEAAYEVF